MSCQASRRTVWSVHALLCLLFGTFLALQPARPQSAVLKTDIVSISVEQQYPSVRPGGQSTLAIDFVLAKGWHFYASAENAPGQMNLKLRPFAKEFITFSEPLFPVSEKYFDASSGKTVDVFSDKFRVFLPFTVSPRAGASTTEPVKIEIEGAVCSDVQCRVPDFGALLVDVRIDAAAPMNGPLFSIGAPAQPKPAPPQAGYAPWFALVLALLAGLSLNIMPCVWPVLPIVVMRIVEQSKAGGRRSTTMGIAFCSGILAFFGVLAAANIILRLAFRTVLQWGDQFRHPAFLAVMAMLLVIMALFSFGVLSLRVPSSIGGQGQPAAGLAGSAGMGFLAAILSTPCSFAILAAAFAWAQSQSLATATVAIMTLGIGMAAPYAILTASPGMLKKLPRPGRWMELFKKTIGFVLLGIALKMVAALPQTARVGALYFALILSFCVWMWGGWVDLNTKPLRKWIIRGIAVALAAGAGWTLLAPPGKAAIDWQSYDRGLIEKAIKEQRPVLIDFSADWCLSCEVVDRLVYSRKDIAELIKKKNVLAVKADTTQKSFPATQALKDIYNEPGVPVTIVFAPGLAQPIRWHGLSFVGELKSFLQKLRD